MLNQVFKHCPPVARMQVVRYLRHSSITLSMTDCCSVFVIGYTSYVVHIIIATIKRRPPAKCHQENCSSRPAVMLPLVMHYRILDTITRLRSLIMNVFI